MKISTYLQSRLPVHEKRVTATHPRVEWSRASCPVASTYREVVGCVGHKMGQIRVFWAQRAPVPYTIRRLGELKLKVNRFKILLQELSPFRRVSVQQWLRTLASQTRSAMVPKPKPQFVKTTHFSVQVKEIESEETHAHLDVFHLYVLSLALAQFLERHQPARRPIYCDGFRVQNERVGTL